MNFEIFDNIIRNVNNLRRFLSLPVCLIVLSLDREAQVIEEAGENLFVLSCPSHDAQEMRGHVLASLVAFAELEGLVVFDGSVHDGLF